MSRSFMCVAAAAFFMAVGFTGGMAHAEWPARVFAPYIYGREGALIDDYNATGQKYFTLAFTTSRVAGAARRGGGGGGGGGFAAGGPATRRGGPATRGGAARRGGGGGGGGARRGAATSPTYPGGEASFSGHPMSENYLADDIAFIRSKGGDVIMSFGGAGGTEIGTTSPDPAKIEAMYQSVIDAYKLTWIDMDIEGGAIRFAVVNHARNTALVNLQKKNPGLIVVYTLAADPNGIERKSSATLRDAKEQGLKVEAVNLMTMDYGASMAAGKKMGDLAITTVLKSYEQMQQIDPAMKIGITPDIGINDEKSEIYGLDDARTVMDWVKDKPYVRLMAFWVSQRDHAHGSLGGDTTSGVVQNDWDYTNITKPFTVGFTPATQP